MNTEQPIWVFFYGSYMNFDVLKDVGLVPDHFETARLSGFDLRIEPLANLIRSDPHRVYGVLATATHRELAKLYAHAQDVLGEVYLPEAVMAETLDGKWRPALCYLSPGMETRPAASEYIDRIVASARHHGFPAWYIERIESFRQTR